MAGNHIALVAIWGAVTVAVPVVLYVCRVGDRRRADDEAYRAAVRQERLRRLEEARR